MRLAECPENHINVITTKTSFYASHVRIEERINECVVLGQFSSSAVGDRVHLSFYLLLLRNPPLMHSQQL